VAKPKLLVIFGSTRPGRSSLPIGRWFVERAQEHGAFDVSVADLAEVDLPFFDEPNHPRLGQYAHEHTRRWSATVESADAFVFITPEYNYGYPAVLKNAIDYLYREWNDKPLGFVSYGAVAGGTRSVQQLRQVAAFVKLVPITEAVHIPFHRNYLDADGAMTSDERLDQGCRVLLDELCRYENALRPLRASRPST